MNTILEDLDVPNYDSVEKVLNQEAMNDKKRKIYIDRVIKHAKTKRNELKGSKAHVTKQYNSGAITAADRQVRNKRIDNARAALKEYIEHY